MSGSAALQLVEPAFRSAPEYSETLGPEVADLAALAGFAPDPEQQLGLDLIFALDAEGKSAAFEFAVVVARQNMKTGLFKQAALGWLFLTDQRLVVWSAHEFSTTQEAFRDMAGLIENCSYLSRRLKRIYRGNGDESIELKSGQRMLFKARTKTGGRGLTGDKVVLDEAFALQPDHLGSLMPTLSVRPDPQLLYGSSAGLATSAVLRRIRDRGRAGSSARLAYLEWCASRDVECEDSSCRHEPGTGGCVLDRRDLWKDANPLLGRKRENGTGLTEEYVASEREALPPEEFARERMGWWDEPGVTEPAFGPGFWESCETPRPDGLTVGSLAIAVTVDLTHASLSAAGQDDDGRAHVVPLEHGPGIGWVVASAKALQDTHDVEVVIDGRGPGAVLIPSLEQAGVRLRVIGTSDVLDACAGIYDRVRDRRLGHEGYAELDLAVQGAVKRKVGDRWAWGRRQSTSDISPLESATLAVWGLQEPTDGRSVYEDRGLVTL